MLVAQTSVALDHRLAVVIHTALMLGAAGALTTAWLRLLPAEREPFAASGEIAPKADRDTFAVFLLLNVTVSLLLRIPGVETEGWSRALAKWLPADWATHGVMIVLIWFGFIPGLAAAYSLARRNPLRWPLVVGGILALALWLASPILLSSIRAAS